MLCGPGTHKHTSEASQYSITLCIMLYIFLKFYKRKLKYALFKEYMSMQWQYRKDSKKGQSWGFKLLLSWEVEEKKGLPIYQITAKVPLWNDGGHSSYFFIVK